MLAPHSVCTFGCWQHFPVCQRPPPPHSPYLRSRVPTSYLCAEKLWNTPACANLIDRKTFHPLPPSKVYRRQTLSVDWKTLPPPSKERKSHFVASAILHCIVASGTATATTATVTTTASLFYQQAGHSLIECPPPPPPPAVRCNPLRNTTRTQTTMRRCSRDRRRSDTNWKLIRAPTKWTHMSRPQWQHQKMLLLLEPDATSWRGGGHPENGSSALC